MNAIIVVLPTMEDIFNSDDYDLKGHDRLCSGEVV